MRLTCPSCETCYEIAPDALGKYGRSVRCARCEAAWFAAARAPAAAPADEPALTAEWDDVPDARHDDLGLGGDPAGPISHSTALVPVDPPAAFDAWYDQRPAIGPAADAASMVPAMEWAPAAELPAVEVAATDVPHDDIETVAARRAPPAVRRHASFRWPRPSVPLVILALTAVLAALIAGRTEVVRLAPQTAALFAGVGLPVNLRGLTFDAIKVSDETQDGAPVMVVEGAIVSASRTAVEVPRMRFALRNGAGVEVYAWTAPPIRPFLNQGETLPFRTRLASPPAEARDVEVRFLNRHDLEAGR
jgi:predicted Zn finger-like uncharacterized protein